MRCSNAASSTYRESYIATSQANIKTVCVCLWDERERERVEISAKYQIDLRTGAGRHLFIASNVFLGHINIAHTENALEQGNALAHLLHDTHEVHLVELDGCLEEYLVGLVPHVIDRRRRQKVPLKNQIF